MPVKWACKSPLGRWPSGLRGKGGKEIDAIASTGAKCERKHGDFQILAGFVTKDGHANGGGFECGQPKQFFDTVIDLPLVACCGSAVFHQKLFWHALIHPRIGGKT